MKPITVEDFYKEASSFIRSDIKNLLPGNINKDIGHFNVFNIEDLLRQMKAEPVMPYNRRTYYKISLICGKNKAEYADKVIDVEDFALVFATPKIPYHWIPQDMNQSGYFCLFTEEFLLHTKSGIVLDNIALFKAGGYPVFQIDKNQVTEIKAIFRKMHEEISSTYVYKYDLLRNYIMELVHYGQKLQPITQTYSNHSSSARVSSLFIELLERQFPLELTHQQFTLRTANDYAKRLAVHVNYLNRTIKEHTGKTTTQLIAARIIKEAKVLLKEKERNISEIAYCLGFEQVAHFSNFLKNIHRFLQMAFVQKCRFEICKH
ncbi:helix-turn-helix domain-containing protein [Mucilaginibacter jinjuensis]|uniref:Helix-turn-helix domain-containing protein n=1 Tax=Mucilaginibacter jinjuensis TaxID=1176721 RepID=A0ABY7TCG8_9SPHI|nr:helix-turn-helix domain-containing protein [Mucilaginibacter jinjuensis]WCT13403.1 helix-turn-helix domain-containing protein [Mucilaginibacter jinjuensis]